MTGIVVAHGKAKSKRRWIADRIESLDPELDHAEIVRLSTTYRVNRCRCTGSTPWGPW